MVIQRRTPLGLEILLVINGAPIVCPDQPLKSLQDNSIAEYLLWLLEIPRPSPAETPTPQIALAACAS